MSPVSTLDVRLITWTRSWRAVPVRQCRKQFGQRVVAWGPFAGVAQSAEARSLGGRQCGFESHRRHDSVARTSLKVLATGADGDPVCGCNVDMGRSVGVFKGAACDAATLLVGTCDASRMRRAGYVVPGRSLDRMGRLR